MKKGDPFGSPSWKSYEDRLTRHQNPTENHDFPNCRYYHRDVSLSFIIVLKMPVEKMHVHPRNLFIIWKWIIAKSVQDLIFFNKNI